MTDLKQISIHSIDHLGVVSALLKKYRVAERIDSLVPIAKDDRTNTTYGQRVCAMILNGLGFTNSTLYMSPEFFQDKPVELLIGEGICAEDLNENALGRGLDALHEYGTTSLFSRLAFDIVQEQGLLGRYNHLDTTSLALFGQYDSDEWDNAPIPSYGHSKDHRPDLKQIVVTLITNGPAGVPLFYDAHDGNASDKTTFHESIALMSAFFQKQASSGDFLWVADSALYNEEKLQKANVLWLTRVPATVKAVKTYVAQSGCTYEWEELGNGYQCTSVEGPEGEYWMLYSSAKGKASQLKTLAKKIEKERIAQEQAFKKATGTLYGCECDARKAVQVLSKKLKYHRVVERDMVAVMGCDKPGRPKAGDKKIKGYRIKVELIEDNEAIATAKEPLGRFILSTNKKGMSGAQVLQDYKGQSQVENGFRFLKDKSFQNNRIFLQNPQRIDALMMIMTLSLLVYNLGQYQLRERLKAEDESVPDQKGKSTKSPTLRWVFQMLSGISSASIAGQEMVIANIGEREAKVIRLLGEETMAIYKIS